MQENSKDSFFSFKNEFFILLLPAFFIIHRLSEHYESIPIRDAGILWVKYVLITLVIYALFFLILRSSRKAFLFTAVLIAFQFSFGTIHDSLKNVFSNSALSKYIFVVPFLLIVILAIFFFIKKTKSSSSKLVVYLNLLLIILIIFDGINFFRRTTKNEKPKLDLTACTTCPKPDIYLIISDGYAGQLQLKDIFKFDNSPFYTELKNRGFLIVENSISNYKFTSNSVTSILNMDYLVNYKEDKSHELTNRTTAINFFSENGYNVKNFSIFKIADQYPFAETNYFPIGTKLITNHTFTSRLYNDLGYLLITKWDLDFAKNNLKQKEERERKDNLEREPSIIQNILKEASKKDGKPKFVYGHLIMPHGPYNYDKNGKPLDENLPENIKYVEYLQYTNKQILKLVDDILKRSKKPPIILFMSDHGHRTEDTVLPEKYYYSNINAVYFPNKDYSRFYNGMSNVNQFRVLLNTYFNQSLSLLKDSMAK